MICRCQSRFNRYTMILIIRKERRSQPSYVTLSIVYFFSRFIWFRNDHIPVRLKFYLRPSLRVSETYYDTGWVSLKASLGKDLPEAELSCCLGPSRPTAVTKFVVRSNPLALKLRVRPPNSYNLGRNYYSLNSPMS
jgi:hypothetical protein